MSHPLEFEIMQERILEALGDYARACADAEAWWRAYKARAHQRPPLGQPKAKEWVDFEDL